LTVSYETCRTRMGHGSFVCDMTHSYETVWTEVQAEARRIRVEEVEVCAGGRWRMWSERVEMDEYMCGVWVHLCHAVTCRGIRHTCVMAHVTLCVCRVGDGTIGGGGGRGLRERRWNSTYVGCVCMCVTLLCHDICHTRIMTHVTLLCVCGGGRHMW